MGEGRRSWEKLGEGGKNGRNWKKDLRMSGERWEKVGEGFENLWR